jgi:lipoyl-dependent peroxiredoxin
MPTRTAHAEWTGAIDSGKGRMEFGSGAFEGPYSFESRMKDGPGTNPEELIGAAHAGCFSMAFSLVLGNAGHPPESIATDAKVKFEQQGEGWAITGIELITKAKVPGIGEDDFQKAAEAAKENCPVSVALGAVDITLDASLEG